MDTLIIALLIGFGFTFFAGSVVYTASHLKNEVPEEDREFLDPLPKLLRVIWPLVRFVDYFICQKLPAKLTKGPTEALRVSGMLYLMGPTQFIALSLITTLLFTFLTWVSLSLIDVSNPIYVFVGAIFGYFYPRIWLSDSLKRRQKQIVRALPVYLDFLTMGVEAGLNMAGAITQAVSKGPAGPLKNEFALVLRDLRSGLTRSESLRRMEERVKVQQLSSFVTAVVQAERMGASLGSTFRFQAEQCRVERFQRAEKLAMEAPVKLIFPLVAFIFPVTFVVLMFPIAVKFMQSGVSF